ncbi:OmpA family protein [bacterium]|nr:OmpA family protein [bacterium]
MSRHYAIGIVLGALFLASCTSIYEAGTDLDGKWAVAPVTHANSDADDLAPLPSAKGLYFTSNRAVGDEELDRMFLLPKGETAPLLLRTTSGEIKNGALLLLPGSGGEVMFTECYRDDAVGDCDIVEGRLSGAGTEVMDVHLVKEVNNVEWDHHPTMSGDGGPGSMLIFASERYGGNGGSDLWMSLRTEKGWSAPVNLGSTLNSSGNEITPWITPAGDELYFASDALPGRGGFDIYRSRRSGKGTTSKWSEPEALGAPVNTESDEVFFHGPADGDTLYFASNREGGKGGFDIYRAARMRIVTPPPPPPPVKKEKQIVLRLRAVNAYTMEPIDAVINVASGDNETEIGEGYGVVEVPLRFNKLYNISATKAGFQNAVEEYQSNGETYIKGRAKPEGDKLVLEHSVIMLPIAEDERKIYAFTVEFDFNLSNIRPEEERKLDSAAILLEQFPQSTVVISGHTDSVGTVSYNVKLGYRRAKQVSKYVLDWLRTHGVKLLNEAEIRTYGESEPVAPNRTDEGRQRNRRVEIAIVRNR